MPFAPSTVSADNLDWSDFRPPLTTTADTVDADGFTHLFNFGGYTTADVRAIAVAPNGDIFAAGRDGAFDAEFTVAGTKPAVFKSTDGGKSWRNVALPAEVTDGTTIRQIVVSPDYPSDDWVGAVFSDGTADADGDNGVCWSTDAGLTFPGAGCFTAADTADAAFEATRMLAIAISPDFNWNDGNGEIAVGGAWEAGAFTTYVAQVNALKAGLGDGDFVGIAEGTADASDAAGDATLSLAYTADEEPISLARIVVTDEEVAVDDADDNGETHGQINAGGWPALSAGSVIEAGEATTGQVGFDDEYSAGGTFFAAVGDDLDTVFAGGGAVGGVFRFNGSTWSNRTETDADCDGDFSSLAIGGNGSATRLIGAMQTAAGSNRVCRSTNEGSSWSDAETDGGDDVCGICGVDPTAPGAALVRIAAHRNNVNTVYHTTSATLGGVTRSTSTGSSWADTGLTNLPYVVDGSDEISATRFFAQASVDGTVAAGLGIEELNALFYTDNYGTSSAYTRVLRADADDLSTIFPNDFDTAGTAYIRRASLTSGDKILKTTNGGMSWDDAETPDPFEDGPESNEAAVASSARSANIVFIGGDKGHVAMTTDGAATWTILSKDFGEDIDEFDFKDNTTFFVTAKDSDNTDKVWLTRDGGATFTQVGDAPWGSGDGPITTDVRNYSATTGTGWILVMTGGTHSTMEVYRMNVGTGTTFTDMDLDVSWDTMQTTGASGVGDGVLLNLWDDGTASNNITFFPFTGDPDDMDPDDTADDEADNLLLAIPVPPVSAGGIGTGQSNPGYTLQEIADGRIVEMTLTNAFLTPPVITNPTANGSVATNIGDEGIPTIIRWNSIPGADAYEVLIGLQPDLADGQILDERTVGSGDPITSNQLTVPDEMFALIQGNTYYVAVRAAEAEGNDPFEGPWANISPFSVSSTSTSVTSPQPNLPLNNSQLPGLTTELSWNNPPGVTQVQIQVTPLNGDGPAINLIIGSAITSYVVPAPLFGTGPYVMLPGASYTWRARVTSSTDPNITENSSSWGPWSEPRLFTTARPNSGTIQLLGPINGEATSDNTPTVQWKDSNTAMFYYEVQMSSDPNFGESGIVAPVYWNLIHGGESTPAMSWTVPDAFAVTPGTYYWRVRQRLQATPAGAAETGIAWSPTQSFVVQ